MNNTKIRIMGEMEAIRYSKTVNKTTAIISIVSKIEKPVNFHNNENICDVFRLFINDLYCDLKDETIVEGAGLAPIQSDFNGLKEFVDKHKDVEIVIHCAAGVSRSAGVGLAVAQYLEHYDIQDYILNSGNFDANLHCYKLALNELTKK